MLAVIAARGGSKGLPSKNIKNLGGRPLLSYSILPVVQSASVDRVVVSTDSPAIAEIARHYGADVPFLRTSELASDTADLISVYYDCLQRLYVEQNYEAEIMIRLMPTYPFKTTRDVDRLVADIVVKKAECATFAHRMTRGGLQDLCLVSPEGGIVDPGIDAARLNQDWFFANNSIHVRTMPPWRYLQAIEDPISRDKAMAHYFLEQSTTGITNGRLFLHDVDPIRGIDVNNGYDFELAEMVLKEKLFDFKGVFNGDASDETKC